MGAIALVIIAVGSALMVWSGFRMRLFGVEMDGLIAPQFSIRDRS
jgi:hypothetical protein